jgi:tRNA dimethylallyltransferase
MKNVFFIVGPTATGKSELAANVASNLGAEVVSGDAFQIYRGLDLLTAKPDAATIARVPHHLIGTLSIAEEMNVERFRRLALAAINDIHARGKGVIVAGGTGLYIKALTHGLSALPGADAQLRVEFEKLTLAELSSRLSGLDPKAAEAIDLKNRRRVVRALEICLLTGRATSTQRRQWGTVEAVVPAADPQSSASLPEPPGTAASTGVFVLRDREELYGRITRRVENMFEMGVIEEVRGVGPVSATAEQTIGLREIRELIAGQISMAQCVERIQQSTRRYAKRQLTWFRRQSSFEALNLSPLSHAAAVDWITARASSALSRRDV